MTQLWFNTYLTPSGKVRSSSAAMNCRDSVDEVAAKMEEYGWTRTARVHVFLKPGVSLSDVGALTVPQPTASGQRINRRPSLKLVRRT